jgi:hypothetical protein
MFLTPDQILQTAKRSEETNRQRMRDCYCELGNAFADALFDVCMAEWRTGPATTWMRLNSSAKDHILHAWQYRNDIEGVLLIRKDLDEYVPLFVHRPSLAHKLSSKTSLWINFRAIKEAMADE